MPTRSQRHLREFSREGQDSTGSPGVGASVTITAPGAGAVSTTLTLSGTATNAEGGNASESINWSSNVDGALGRGASIDVTITAGAHTLTAEVGGVTDTVAVTAS
jgi:hypothetical protein